MRVLVLGAYGLIGTATTHALLAHGHEVSGLGRSTAKGKRAAPEADWIAADISAHTTHESWLPLLKGIDGVVNAAGLLQNGLNDNVAGVQRDAIKALIHACEQSGIRALVQVSAPGAAITSDTEFFRTKAEADQALKASGLDWTILRPGLVLSPHAYGGTSLIRRLAAMPGIQGVMLGQARIQTVHVQDVANAIVYALEHKLSGVDAALVEETPHTLKALVLRIREWLGFGAPVMTLSVPLGLGRGLAFAADLAGYLGWRSSLARLDRSKTSHTGRDITRPALHPAGAHSRTRDVLVSLSAVDLVAVLDRVWCHQHIASGRGARPASGGATHPVREERRRRRQCFGHPDRARSPVPAHRTTCLPGRDLAQLGLSGRGGPVCAPPLG